MAIPDGILMDDLELRWPGRSRFLATRLINILFSYQPGSLPREGWLIQRLWDSRLVWQACWCAAECGVEA